MEESTAHEVPTVIWVTGYPSSGKTTVARRVDERLKQAGIPTILLDGDELRSILSSKWGYTREERGELARVYFRLSNYLASQGYTVVIAAVAMYDEVRQWIHQNVSRPIEVYLRVPEAERKARARQQQKVVYEQTDLGGYDEPSDPDVVVENFGSTTVDDAVEAILQAYERSAPSLRVQHDRDSHWAAYYRRNGGVFEPTPFAKDVNERLGSASSVLEVGCGNGRDAVFLAGNGHRVTALDTSTAAIELCGAEHADSGVRFVTGHLPDLVADLPGHLDAVYSRFCFHAMTEDEERDVLASTAGLLRPGGRLYVECRSVNDPLARQGEVISPTERIHGHYRRFIALDGLSDRVNAAGLDVVETLEANGLAVFGDEDPVVIRLVAEKATS